MANCDLILADPVDNSVGTVLNITRMQSIKIHSNTEVQAPATVSARAP